VIGAFSRGCWGVNPALRDIEDVGNDQGRQVRLTWERSLYDAPGDSVDIPGYEVYRRRDEYLLQASRPRGHRLAEDGPAGDPLLAGWDYLGDVPAHGDSLYQAVMPTLCDSTDLGICWSVFFIRAVTPAPFTYLDSRADSGYSIDNLAPAPPPGLAMISPTELAWDESEAEDFDYFTVYGSDRPTLDGSAAIIGYTIATGMDVSGQIFGYYHVTAIDFSGNEGGASSVCNAYADVTEGDLPDVFRLSQNSPNPFGTRTVIGFDLPEAGTVRLEVFDTQGRLVRVLTDRHWPAGRHTLVWSGETDTGEAPGVYLARINAGDFTDTKKVFLMR
jgi:hypothetical protein